MGRYTQKISQRLIPLPKEISCNDIKKVAFNDVKIDVIFPEDALLLSAKRKLVSYFGNSLYGSFRIRIVDPMPNTVNVLNHFKNPDQAYHIWSDGAINISALTSKGIMNGVRTLLQAVTKEDGMFNIPLLFVYDYPDMSLRGQWGGDSMDDISYTASLKLNSLDYSGTFSIDSAGVGKAVLEKPAVLENSIKEGVVLCSYIPHLEFVIGGYLNKPEYKDVINKIKNVPTEEAAARNDYKPGLCVSSEDTKKLVFDWMCSLAEIKGVKSVMVWLSENAEPCMCEKCKGHEPFLLETEMLVELFEKFKKLYPDKGREILLTQGSFSVNEKILEIIPNDISVLYYHGSKTYISDKNPMIYEGLMPFIEKGGKMGVYPQITHGWRCVFPWTAPDFIKYRCEEFTEKNIHKVVGYAVPSNIYHRFNVAAMAEWLWNTKGRDEESFMRAYATVNDIDPDGFVKWCTLNMTPAWVLAENRFIVSQMFNYQVIMKTKFDIEDFRFTDFTRTAIKDIDKYIRMADKAIKAAKQIEYEEGETESKCIASALRCAGAYQKFFTLLKIQNRNPEEDQQMVLMYEMMHNNSKNMYSALLDWKCLIDRDNSHFQTRIIDTAAICMRITDFMRSILEKLEIKHKEHHSLSYHQLGRWDESMFNKEGIAELTYDITRYSDKDGRYHICFDYIDSKQGTTIKSISVLQDQVEISSILYDNINPLKRINMYEPWYEVFIDITCASRNEDKILKVIIEGPSNVQDTCKGLVGIRKV
ncbi:MAG: glycoside hydrolase family 20 zincin-like fold domain-containing protein [Clostridia bacterium]